MADDADKLSDPARWSPETQLVHGGVLRSQYGETSEALFLTQGFVYASAEEAEGALHRREPRVPVFAVRQPDRRRCSRSACG